MGSIPDMIMNKLLINERNAKSLELLLLLGRDKFKKEKLLDLFDEHYHRIMCRYSQYQRKKAYEVLSLNQTLEEAKDIINPNARREKND